MPVVVVLALIVGALANTHLDPLAAGISDTEIAQINLVARRRVLCLAFAAERRAGPTSVLWGSSR